MIIDAHVHIGRSIFGYELSPECMLESMKECGIQMTVISPVQPMNYHLEPENDYMALLVEQHSDQLIGFGRVDPRQGEKAVLEVKRAISVLGLKGIFLHPWEEGYRVNAEFVVPVVRTAAELGVPIMIASGYPWVSHALQIAYLAGLVPEASIIMTNGGQINISGMAQPDVYEAMRSHNNLYIETAGMYRQDFLENCIHEFGSKRVIFGSNGPRMHQGFELDRAISASKNNEANQMDVLGISMGRLLKIL
ncbi:amidohydrolase family protein [Paenibacillus agricola]|uniref:Amidohydrolase family protein n=1 Tax=Paenibacillus agricola TaxID=2716264 RepID=A0ABX0J8T5_9BACL|nr:amidohydrolase family protein [Paenibacillus agricola]NHN31726.1 amidohydrolase family protein [Paenibacillus agricola]